MTGSHAGKGPRFGVVVFPGSTIGNFTPDQAVDFIKQTGCDALAIAIGTSHGAYKFSRPPTGPGWAAVN